MHVTVYQNVSIVRHKGLLCLIGVLLPSMGADRVVFAWPSSCAAVLKELKLPARLDTKGKPRRAKWEKIDRVLTEVRRRLGDNDCNLKFSEIFRTDRNELFVPLTNNLIRTVPEDALKGVTVFDQSGEPIGEYVGRVAYNRTGGLYATQSYTLYYFQFRDRGGELQSTGNRLLLDDFLVSWNDLRDRSAIGPSHQGEEQ